MSKVDKYQEDGHGGKKVYPADANPWQAPTLSGNTTTTRSVIN